jgi:MFS family permease
MDAAETSERQEAGIADGKSVDELRGLPLRRALSLATIAWIFGSVWMTAVAGTPQTNVARELHASEFQFGLLSALPFIASLLSLPASMLIERTGLRKRIFLWGLYPNRILWIPIALVPLWLVQRYPGSEPIAMMVFLWLMFLMHSGQAVGGPGWVSWMADIVPDRKRGKYFSRRRQWGILSAVPTGLAVGWLLDRYAGNGELSMLRWCAAVFIAAGLFGVVDIYLFHYVPDVPRRPRTGLHLLRAMKEPLKNRQFLWIGGFVAMLVFAVSFMGQFVTKYIMEEMARAGAKSINMTTQMMLIVAPNLAALLVIGSWGKAADRMGKKPLLVLSALGLAPVGAGWCLVSGGNPWLGYLLAMAGAMLWQGVDVANWNLVMEMSGSGDGGSNGGSAYAAVNGVVINVAGMLGGLASGIIAQSLEHWQYVTWFKTFRYYDVLFALSAFLRLAAVVIFLPHIHEVNARPTHETLKFMTANIYNNLFNAVQQPLKMLGLGRKEDEVRKPV